MTHSNVEYTKHMKRHKSINQKKANNILCFKQIQKNTSLFLNLPIIQ